MYSAAWWRWRQFTTLTLVTALQRPYAKIQVHYVKSNMLMLGRLTILIIILKSALCCKDTQFIIDYATLYSYSEITIVTNMHEIEEPIRHKSTAYISYESTGAENAMEDLREMQDLLISWSSLDLTILTSCSCWPTTLAYFILKSQV